MESRLRTGALLVLAWLAAASAAGETLSRADRERLSQRTITLWEQGAERFRAVIHLLPPADAALPMAARHVDQPKARLDAVQRCVSEALADLESKLDRCDFELRHASRLRPELAADLSRDGLLGVLRHPAVSWVEQAETWWSHTNEGLPLIGADVLHTAGITGAGYAIAIIDTGIDPRHPTLGGGEIPSAKVVYGLDTADRDGDPADCSGHGTAVASIAAGLPYSWGSTTRFAGGAAPGATILAYKASPDSSCDAFDSRDVVAAIDDAVLNRDAYNVVAINLSIGGERFAGPCDGDARLTSYAAAVRDATEAGIAVIVSSGNEADHQSLGSPACLSSAISVASVYDQDGIGWIAYCGDNPGDSCSPYLCQDNGPGLKDVTCYSNTNPYLDLYAPSEIGHAAAMGGRLTELGGTSGAAPYVAGAVALLHQALPGMDAIKARFLLALTGEPVTELGRGLTRPLLNLAAATTRDDVAVGEGGLSVPNGTGQVVVSTASLESDGIVESVTVILKLVHGRPRQLVATLVAPDGTRVVLHDHQAGTTDESGTGHLLGATGIYATYPDDRLPAQSLDALVGRPARGTWTLEVVDDDPAPAPGPTPRLLGWGLQATTEQALAPPSGSATSLVLPVAVHAAGANQTFWVSDVRVHNSSLTHDARLRLYLVPQGADGLTSFESAPLVVPARTVVDLPDVLGELFGVVEDQGSLIFDQAPSGLVATSRTYNTGGSAGTYGQFVGVVDAAASVAAGDQPVVLLQLASSPSYRTNVGFTEIAGAEATVRLTLHDGDTGAPLASPGVFPVPAFSNIQVNRAFSELTAGSSDNAFAIVEVVAGGGRVAAYASVVDNLTGDAITVPGGRPLPGTAMMVPIVAKVEGEAGTSWVTDLRIFNGALDDAELELELRPAVGTNGELQRRTVNVGAGQVLAANDVIASVFALGSASGSMRVVPRSDSAQLLITTRTYNRTDGGTYGQLIGAVASGYTASDRVVVIHVDGSADFRSNLGLCEVAGGTVALRYALKSATGSTLGVGTITLGPFQVRQVNDVFADLAVVPQPNARVEIFLDSGDGAYTAYASVVDNLSGDAIFVPAVNY